VGYGHTQSFTRPLRDLYIRHRIIARSHAFMHDAWMYCIAVASGTARFLADCPTTLYRCHGKNSSGAFGGWVGSRTPRLITTWPQHQLLRRVNARHAAGFILASATLPQSPKLEGLLTIARLIAVINERQSPAALLELVRQRAIWPSARLALGLAANCLLTDVRSEIST
jgi:hypothetical protein